MARRVLVTGASRGIGRAIAERLAVDGWSVAVHFTRRFDAAEEVREALGTACSGVYSADLTDPANAVPLLQAVLADGPVDAVVNNAGMYIPQPFLIEDDDAFDQCLAQTMALNLESPIRLCRAAAKHFVEIGSGRILNVASRVGFRGEANAAIYAASKAGLINLTRSLAVELAPWDIGVFGIAPGWVETAMARDGMTDRLDDILATIPLGRMASPEDCASAASFLLSDDALYLSGVTIDINGASYFH